MKNNKNAQNPCVSTDYVDSQGEAPHSSYGGASPKIPLSIGVEFPEELFNTGKNYSNIEDIYYKNIVKSSYKLDWLSFTLNIASLNEIKNDIYTGYDNDISIVFDLLSQFGISEQEFEVCPPVNFFNSGLTIGGFIKILYNDVSKPIVSKSLTHVAQVIFTGQGCTYVYSKVKDNYKILNIVYDNCKSITRVDFAFDDFEDFLSLDVLIDKVENYEYRSAKRSHNILKEEDSEGKIFGKTLYIGNRSSSSYYLRAYDKKAQYLKKGNLLPDFVEINDCKWERYELSFLKDKAEFIVSEFLYSEKFQNDIDILFKSVMRDCITFVDKEYKKDGSIKNFKHKERWKTSKFWVDYLESSPKFNFDSSSRDPDFVSTLAWVSESVIPTLYMLDNILKDYNINIYSEIEKLGKIKRDLSKKHYRTILDSKKITKKEMLSIINEFQKNNLHRSTKVKKIKNGD